MIAKLKTALLASIAACALVAVVPALSPVNLFTSAAHASGDDNGSDDHGGGSESHGSESHGSGHSSDDGADHDANDDHGGNGSMSSDDDSNDDDGMEDGKEHGKKRGEHGGRARGMVDLSSLDPTVLENINAQAGSMKVTLADGTVLRYELEREHGKQVLKVKFPRTLTEIPTTILVNGQEVNVAVKAPKTLVELFASMAGN